VGRGSSDEARGRFAFTGYCHSQDCKIYTAIHGGSEENTILRNRVGDEGGEWGAQAERCLQRIVLIRAQKPLSKRISCKGQGGEGGKWRWSHLYTMRDGGVGEKI